MNLTTRLWYLKKIISSYALIFNVMSFGTHTHLFRKVWSDRRICFETVHVLRVNSRVSLCALHRLCCTKNIPTSIAPIRHLTKKVCTLKTIYNRLHIIFNEYVPKPITPDDFAHT